MPRSSSSMTLRQCACGRTRDLRNGWATRSIKALRPPGKGRGKPMTLSKSQASLINRHVLIVEDEYLIADDIAQVLEQAGAAVVGPAPTRATALALLTSERIDIAVLD